MLLSFKQFLEYNAGPVGTFNDGPGSGFANSGALAYVSSHATGTETYKNKLDSLDGVLCKSVDNLKLNIPVTTRTGRITHIEKTSNPMKIRTEDGTGLFMSRGDWIRNGRPEAGETCTVKIQATPYSNKPGNILSFSKN